MNALTILLLVVTVIYLTIYQRGFWAYYFGILIPYYIITQITPLIEAYGNAIKRVLIN